MIFARQHIVGLAWELCLAEFLEDRLPIFFGNTDPRVLNFDDRKPTLSAGTQSHSPTFGRELDRIRQQVVKNLTQLPRILTKQRYRLVNPAFKRDVLPL